MELTIKHTQRNWWKDLYVEKAPSLHFRKLDVLWFINEVGISWNEEKTLHSLFLSVAGDQINVGYTNQV